MSEASSSQTTLRPPAARPTSTSPQKSASSSSSIPRPPLSAHASATVSELVSFQGTHPISIGAGTVIHPRAKLLSFEGPISIGEGCILGEKSVVGGGTSNNSTRQVSTETEAEPSSEPAASTPTILESSIQVGPLATISEGAHVRSAATVDTSASLGRRVRVGKHAKVCASCCIPDNQVVDDWIVIWGNGGSGNNCGSGLQRRRKPHDRGSETTVGLGVQDVEAARLTVLNRERETLTKLIDAGTGARRK